MDAFLSEEPDSYREWGSIDSQTVARVAESGAVLGIALSNREERLLFQLDQGLSLLEEEDQQQSGATLLDQEQGSSSPEYHG